MVGEAEPHLWSPWLCSCRNSCALLPQCFLRHSEMNTLLLVRHTGIQPAAGGWLVSQAWLLLIPWTSQQGGANRGGMQRGERWSRAESLAVPLPDGSLLVIPVPSRVVAASSDRVFRREV